MGDHPHSTYAHGGGEGSRQMNTTAYEEEGGGFKVAYVRKKKDFYHKISKLSFFTKEAITLPFIIVYRKVQPVLSYK